MLSGLAGRGLVDFTKADLQNPRWWIYLGVMTRELNKQLLVEQYDRALQFNTAKLAIDGIDNPSFEAAQKRSVDVLQKCFELLFPWHEQEEQDNMAEEAWMLRQAWAEVFGDPEDPEVQDRIRRTSEALRTLPGASEERQRVEDVKRRLADRARELKELVRQRRQARAHRGIHR